MNKKFFILQVVILIAFTLLFCLALNPESVSMILNISEELNWDINIQKIPIIPENTRSQLVFLLPALMIVVFTCCWIEERISNNEDTESNIRTYGIRI